MPLLLRLGTGGGFLFRLDSRGFSFPLLPLLLRLGTGGGFLFRLDSRGFSFPLLPLLLRLGTGGGFLFSLDSGAFFGKGFCLCFGARLGSFEFGLNTGRFFFGLATHLLGFGFFRCCSLLPRAHFRFALCFCGGFQFCLYSCCFLFCLKTTVFSIPPCLFLGITSRFGYCFQLRLDARGFLLGAQSRGGFSLCSGFCSLPLHRFLFDFRLSLDLGGNLGLLSGDCCSLQLRRFDRLQPACLAFFLSYCLGRQIFSAGRLEHTGEIKLLPRVRQLGSDHPGIDNL